MIVMQNSANSFLSETRDRKHRYTKDIDCKIKVVLKNGMTFFFLGITKNAVLYLRVWVKKI